MWKTERGRKKSKIRITKLCIRIDAYYIIRKDYNAQKYGKK